MASVATDMGPAALTIATRYRGKGMAACGRCLSLQEFAYLAWCQLMLACRV